MQKVKRVIIDTNLWISFLITKNYAQFDQIIYSGNNILVFSKEFLDEFVEVANRPKFRRFFSKTDLESLLETIDEFAEFTLVEKVLDICRDPKDNFLLALSVDAEADFLITGDKDLLDLNTIGKTRILTILSFMAIHRKK